MSIESSTRHVSTNSFSLVVSPPYIILSGAYATPIFSYLICSMKFQRVVDASKPSTGANAVTPLNFRSLKLAYPKAYVIFNIKR